MGFFQRLTHKHRFGKWSRWRRSDYQPGDDHSFWLVRYRFCECEGREFQRGFVWNKKLLTFPVNQDDCGPSIGKIV